MRYLLTTQSQNCYREQIQKEMMTRLAWKRHYAERYPSCYNPENSRAETTRLPRLHPEPADHRTVLPTVTRKPEKKSDPSPPPPPPPPPLVSLDEEGRLSVAPLMRPVSPQTRSALYQESSHHGKGRTLYLQRRGRIRPEERFGFPVLSSWEYGWRLDEHALPASSGDYSLDYATPSRAKSSVVKNTFYARNGVFDNKSATDTLS